MASEPAQFLQGKRIIVAGGGISALAFVLALEQLWPSGLSSKAPEITVFERDTRQGSIQQDAYTLDMTGGSPDEGLVALQQLGLLDDVSAHSTLNSGLINVWSDKWKFLASINPKAYGDLPAATMRITRENLKRVLLDKAEKGNSTFRWQCVCTSAERLMNEQIRVTVQDADTGATFTEDCDLLIAADGANSKIREAFRPFDMKMEYSGATQIGGVSHLPQGLPHPVEEDYGLQMSSGEGVCCIYTPFDAHTIGWAVSTLGPARDAKAGDFTPEQFAALKKEALDTASMFEEPFQTIIAATDQATAFVRPAFERQPFQHDARMRGVVFVGDANRVVNPFVLAGANLALKDGWDLAEQLCRNGSLDAAVTAYDKLSIPRAAHAIKFSHERIRFGHSTGLMWKVYKYGMAAQRKMAKK
ncbi:Zeaxanthin epoxidase, chloroplastic [Cytospora mali]|uniref:Zeaxanthin epoxidase, chloroplastic n=1 Tax=Cytospora mali TaxID=578113 RepID=A0A194V8A2_CYTMA|nr:Zeaxanthin epoxidase, chloroplastic [Valsa mali var. pyri (nom. inval.)]